LVWTTLRTERPASPRISVPGSPRTGEVAQEPTQVPVEAGAAGLFWPPRPVRPPRPLVPSSEDTPTKIAVDTATIAATTAASRARYLAGGVMAPPSRDRVMLCCSPREVGARGSDPMSP